MAPEQIEIMVLASIVACACALPGVFLVLRRVSLMSDAISHAILLGIVIAFLFVKDLSSPLLLAGATLTGLLTVALTEMAIKTRKMKEDAAIGLVFPVLFSIGVLLISRYAWRVHLDSDCVLFGEIAMAPFNRMVINGVDAGPMGWWVMGGVLAINMIFVSLFYKELKLSTFDPGLAASLGFAPAVINYAMMGMVSVTCVGAFEHVGSILVVALMIAPACTAYLLTERLSRMILYSVGFGICAAIIGYFLAMVLDASISGCMAVVSGLLFLLALIFAPERGLLARFFYKRFNQWDFALKTLVVHLLQAEYGKLNKEERVVGHMYDHMLWEKGMTTEVIAQGLKEGYLKKDGDVLTLTPFGREKAKAVMAHD